MDPPGTVRTGIRNLAADRIRDEGADWGTADAHRPWFGRPRGIRSLASIAARTDLVEWAIHSIRVP